MERRTKTTLLLAVTLLTMALLSATAPQAKADGTVAINFTATGYSRYDGSFYTIDGTTYGYWNPAPTFNWAPGSTHTVVAVTPITNWDGVKYKFGSWTNGNGLTTSSGSFVTPSAGTTVTLNYVQSTFTTYFAVSGTSNFDGSVLTIDGVTYQYSSLPTTPFSWESGSTHTVEAISPVYSYDTPSKGYQFVSWTNGNGLVSASGTFTMPAQDVTVTANYAQSTVQVLFRLSGLSNLNTDTVLTIDGTAYSYWDVANTNFQWTKGSTHTVTAAASLTGWDSVTHYFQTWTNGNGLTGTSGTFTVPTSGVTVTANYGLTAPSATTSLTVSCSQPSIDPGNPITISGTLTSGATGISGKTITLTYSDGVNWLSIGSAATGSDGSYTYSWMVPAELTNGLYPIKATFAGDSSYQASSATTGMVGNGPTLYVTPENNIGALLAMVACFGGALVFFRIRGKRKKT